ncbi:MAG: D-glycero-alpha-D-manno-heptose-1,7-bisphosphate 7-phosphatase [Solirubrobacteraceae bacterium]
MSAARAVFVDRDGVVNELVCHPVSGRPESPLEVADVRLIAGAAAALRKLAEAGWLLVGISNQPAAAKGLISLAALQAIQGRVVDLLRAERAGFDLFQLCLHHPDGIVSELAGRCACRKPAPGMLLGAAEALGIDCGESWMVGDTDSDMEAGRRAGCRTLLVEHPGSAHKRRGVPVPTAVAPSLAAAAALILEMEGVPSLP